MGKIRVLSGIVASQVAAGEVVERPASVVKELLENSIDAGASAVEVEVRGAGTALLRVTDDGAGMDREDALLALERHATSKITTAADLDAVRTMGFRGEALPSIASVAEFTMRTRPEGAQAGSEVVVRGGKLVDVRDAGCPRGTTIEVRSLFFNVPARKKFLRSEATECSHLDRVIQNAALAFPSIALAYLRDGRVVHRLAAVSSLAVRATDLFGTDDGGQFLEIDPLERDGIRVSGLVSRPGVTRADRSRQFFFVNGRPVDSPFLAAGWREAYRQMLETGRYPSLVLHLQIDPREMDCNVHPAKREVRFRRGPAVRDAVGEAVASALRAERAAWLRPVKEHVRARLSALPPSPAPVRHQPELAPVSTSPATHTPEPAAPEAVKTPPPETADRFRVVGPLGERYLLLEGAEGLVLLDCRAARQRILFERLQHGVAGGAVAAQRLLMPSVFALPPRLHEAVVENLDTLSEAGFVLESFGGTSLKVEALPDFLAERDPQRVLEEFAQLCLDGSPPRGRPDLAAAAARRSVARLADHGEGAGDERAQRELVTRLLACELPYCDPDGRPVMLQFSWRDLDRKFGRS